MPTPHLALVQSGFLFGPIATLIAVTDVVSYLHNLDSITGSFISAIESSQQPHAFDLHELLGVQKKVSAGINEAYKEIIDNLQDSKPKELRYKAKEAYEHTALNSIRVKHDTLIGKILVLHRRGVTAEGSYDEDGILFTRITQFKRAFGAQERNILSRVIDLSEHCN